MPNTPYDGKFTFVRLRYGPPTTAIASQRLPWSHDYPTGEQHFMKILNELSLPRRRTPRKRNILTFDDPRSVQVSGRLPVRAGRSGA